MACKQQHEFRYDVGSFFWGANVMGLRNQPEYWRERAEEARGRANRVTNKGSKRVLLRVAIAADHLTTTPSNCTSVVSNRKRVF
jgi:hypothetical protein